MKEISLIVPCYNAVKYIDHFLEAVEVQTIGMDQLEVIFVDDASTDATFQKLCEWEQKYPESIMVIHCEKNGKQGAARNIGVGYSTAEYIAFADIDDTMSPFMYEKMYRAAIDFSSDLVICRSKRCKPDETQTELLRTDSLDWNATINSTERRKVLLDMDFNVAVWNKLYKKNIICDNQVLFPEGIIYEDIFFSALIKHYVKDIYVIEEELYRHIIWENSTSNDNSDWRKKIDWLFVEELKIAELKKRSLYEEFKEYYDGQFVLNYLTLLKNLISNYGFISSELVLYLKKRVLNVYPHFLELDLVNHLLIKSKDEFIKTALNGFKEDITKDYMNKLVFSVLPE